MTTHLFCLPLVSTLRAKWLLCAALALALGSPAWATSLKLESSKGAIHFEAKGKPGFLKIRGEGPGPSGELTMIDGKISGNLELELASLDSKIELRNKHMKEKYLEVEKFPKAVLKLKDLPLHASVETQKKADHLALTGELTLHGKSVPLKEATFSYNAEGKSVKVQAQFQVALSEFDIAIPDYAGITVAKDVSVSIETEVELLGP